jgi:hypothetical protein
MDSWRRAGRAAPAAAVNTASAPSLRSPERSSCKRARLGEAWGHAVGIQSFYAARRVTLGGPAGRRP